MRLEKIKKLQEELSQKVISKNILPLKIEKICAVDVSYDEKRAYCSAVILDRKTLEILESKNSSFMVSAPYVPGFFMIREAKPILQTLKRLKTNFDILLIDGNGILHPRKCGLACYVGLKLDKPTIGIAKKLLCGKVKDNGKVELDGDLVGHRIKNQKEIFVSIGHKINLQTATKLVKELVFEEHWYPEPLRVADKNSRNYKKSFFKD